MNTLMKSLLLTAGLALACSVSAADPRAPQADITKEQHMKHAEEMFNRMDTNKDGKITADERAARHHGHGMGPGASMPAEITKAEHMKWAQERFNQLDTNKDGKISADERAAMRGKRHMGMGASMPAEFTKAQYLKWAEERFDRMDANKDGKVSTEEHKAMRGHRDHHGQHGSMMYDGRGHGQPGTGRVPASAPAAK